MDFFGPRSCATRPNKTFLPEEAFATRAKKFYLAEERSDEAQKIQIWPRVIKYFLSKCICNFISRVPTKGVFRRFGPLKIVFFGTKSIFLEKWTIFGHFASILVIFGPKMFFSQKKFFLKKMSF